jgi:trimethylamine--corrinoid protein Co-methyltransferase
MDLLSTGGLLDALMTFDFAKAVIDGEIGLMLKQVAHGLAFDEENLALDVIAEVGPGGTFIDHVHTLKHMRTTALLPEIADRDPRQRWEEAGRPDSHARAMRRVRDILARDNPAVFSPEVDARIRAEFADLVAGDATRPPA